MDLANGRHGAPNGGVAAGAEETVVRRRKQMELVREAIHGLLDERRRDCQGEEKGLAARQQLQEEEEGLLSSLLTKVHSCSCPVTLRVWIVSFSGCQVADAERVY
jgi:hypothetical protein